MGIPRVAQVPTDLPPLPLWQDHIRDAAARTQALAICEVWHHRERPKAFSENSTQSID
jgi:hypothetical protein